MNKQEIKSTISELKQNWYWRNNKFEEWLDILNLEDKYKTQGMESYVSNEPRTFLNMAMYLLTAGEMRHMVGIEQDDPISLESQSRVDRACQYMWRRIDDKRRRGGAYPVRQERGFNLLLFGWYAEKSYYDKDTNTFNVVLWPPANVYPKYEDDMMTAVVHEYKLDVKAAVRKARENNWQYEPKIRNGEVTLQDFFYLDDDPNYYYNVVLIEDEPVTPVTLRDDVLLLVAPVGGFPEKALQRDYVHQANIGQGIFADISEAYDALNKWATYQMQILREVTEQQWLETSAGAPKIDPDKLRQSGAVFQLNPGESLEPIQKPPPPIELSATIMSLRRDIAKSSFTDLVYGMAEQAISGLAATQQIDASAHQVLYPYREAADFVTAEHDRFWLQHMKSSKKVFEVKGNRIEKLKPTDIPDNVSVEVTTQLATPRDWQERGTIAGMLEPFLDNTTILNEILQMQDPQEVKRRKADDMVLEHPMSVNIRLAGAYRRFAEERRHHGDKKQAEAFERAADALEQQSAAPPAGQARPAAHTEAETKREAGAPREKPRARPEIVAPGTLTSEERRA